MGKMGIAINFDSSEKKNINGEEDTPYQEDTSFDEEIDSKNNIIKDTQENDKSDLKGEEYIT